MKITNMVSTGLILSLLGSNIIIGNSYVQSNEKYQKEIKVKNEIIESKRTEIKENESIFTQKLAKKDDKIHVLTEDMNIVKNDLNQTKNKLIKSEKENTKLKKELKERKEANKRRFYVEATAYTAMCEEGCTGTTYTEVDVRNTIYYKGMRVIASDNTLLPLYSIVQVKTKNETFKAIVLDRGGGIDNYEIDLLVRNESDAREFGRQKALITVLKEGNS